MKLKTLIMLLIFVILLLFISNIIEIINYKRLQKNFLRINENNSKIIHEKETQILKLKDELKMCKNIESNDESVNNIMTFYATIEDIKDTGSSRLFVKELIVNGIQDNLPQYSDKLVIRIKEETKITKYGKICDINDLKDKQLIKVYSSREMFITNPPIIEVVKEIEIIKDVM